MEHGEMRNVLSSSSNCLGGQEQIAEEVRNYPGLVKHLLSTSCETCLESDWFCGRVMACWHFSMSFDVLL